MSAIEYDRAQIFKLKLKISFVFFLQFSKKHNFCLDIKLSHYNAENNKISKLKY
jgi:hypothetical protein